MKRKVQINDNSIKSAGLPIDYKESIAEFIWNGFDAKASEIKIDFDNDNALKHITSFSISDNGEGIDYNHLDRNFGAFLDSEKLREYQRSSYIHGKKGKGRFAFQTYSHKAVWSTVYNDKNFNKEYDISVEDLDKDYFDPTTPNISDKKSTGTTVTFYGIFGITASELESDDFLHFLRCEYGWFLHLNRERDFNIQINGKKLDYASIIADSEEVTFKYQNKSKENTNFKVNYIRWSSKIGERFYYYFLNSDKIERAKKLTSFNNKSDEFYHSVYVESDYFNGFELNEAAENQQALLNKNQTDEAYKGLYKFLISFLAKKRKEFVRKNSAKLIQRFEEEGVMPKFNQNKYDQERRKDFVGVVKEIYSVEPKIFINLGEEQKKSFLGMLNLLLDTEERENILQIIDSVVHDLSSEERSSLAQVLKKTSLSRIVGTINLIKRRYEVIELLKTLVFDLEKFTNERDHVQKVMEENYWLLGEQYHLVSADKTFEEALANYLYILGGGKKQKTKPKIDNIERNRRPDIFMCRKMNIPDWQDVNGEMEENIIVELKAPSIVLGKKQFRQVDDYLDIITKESRFNSATRKWRFYLIGKSYDEYIANLYVSSKGNGDRYLVHKVDKYEIHVMTWDDVFRSFDIKHKYLLEKLEFDKKAIQEELDIQGIVLSRKSVDAIKEKILERK